jgi:hypothetical protein
MVELSLLSILPILFSKEMFSYDSEKVVILCILSFILGSYFYTKNSLSNIFNEHRNNLKNEVVVIHHSEIILLDRINSFVEYQERAKFQLSDFSIVLMNNINMILFRINGNYFLSLLNIGKDYLNLFFKGINVSNNLKNYVDVTTITNKFLSSKPPTLESEKDDIMLNESLLLIYNKVEANIEFTPNLKNYYIFYQ